MKRRDLIKLSGISALFASISHELFSKTQTVDRLMAKESEITTSIQINWRKEIAKSNPLIFGSNDYEITRPHKAQDREFQNLLGKLDIPLIRIHHADLSDRWTDSASKTWDEAKIKAGYDASYPQNPSIVQNIPRWATWMAQDSNRLLSTAEYDNYANFCAELVTIINHKQNRNVLYWEPLNELEKRYEKHNKLSELWEIYNRAARAMKQQDARIKIGGPALTWDNDKVLAQFLRNCKDNIDFISWHRYGTGDPSLPTDKLLSSTPMYREQVTRLRSVVKKYISDRHIPLFLSEYNINYSWKSGEMRQNTHIGAIWFASVLKHLVEAEIDMATSWHLKDGVYGMIDPKNSLRPAATVFAWGNKYLVGKVLETKSDHSFIESLAVEQSDNRRSLLLINKSSLTAQVTLQSISKAFATNQVTGFHLDKSGVKSLTDMTSILDNSSLTLKPLSLLLLNFPTS